MRLSLRKTQFVRVCRGHLKCIRMRTPPPLTCRKWHINYILTFHSRYKFATSYRMLPACVPATHPHHPITISMPLPVYLHVWRVHKFRICIWICSCTSSSSCICIGIRICTFCRSLARRWRAFRTMAKNLSVVNLPEWVSGVSGSLELGCALFWQWKQVLRLQSPNWGQSFFHPVLVPVPGSVCIANQSLWMIDRNVCDIHLPSGAATSIDATEEFAPG